MKCFFHENRDAVATCQHCGKTLCRECAEKHNPCLCGKCYERQLRKQEAQVRAAENERRQKYVDALVDTRSEFISTCLKGVLLGIVVILISLAGDMSMGFGELISNFLLTFFIPFGWRLLTYLQSFIPLFIIGTPLFWLFWVVMKAGISIFVGIPAFACQLLMTLWNQRKIARLENSEA